MVFLRNPEIKRWLMQYAVLVCVAVVGAWCCGFGSAVAVYVLVICVLAGVLFVYTTVKRYREIAGMSEQLDRVLHGEENVNLVPDREGELAVLSGEIYKMTVRLREQTQLLQKEKHYLSRSMEDISHQIKTPITSLRMILPRLGREETDRMQRREYVQEAGQLLMRMEWLITALLKMARLESGSEEMKREVVEVQTVIDRALAPLEIPLELKGITVDCEVGQGVCFVGDCFWSAEAVGNILKNCMEHTPDGGKLRICASENALYTEIVIADSGEGILKEELPHLFERFYRGKNSGTENAGIGLSLSRMIITGQNGTIRAFSKEGKGAEFHIRFYKEAV